MKCEEVHPAYRQPKPKEVKQWSHWIFSLVYTRSDWLNPFSFMMKLAILTGVSDGAIDFGLLSELVAK